MAVFRAL